MVKFNKKGLMVKFLTTVILALVIFVPACMMVSKLFFRLSDQAKDNYLDLTKKLPEYARSTDEKPKSFLLITDGETGIFLFAEEGNAYVNSKTATIDPTTEFGKTVTLTSNYFFAFPKQQCSSVPCICLCREFKILEKSPLKSSTDQSIGSISHSSDQELGCNSLTCQQLEGRYQPWSYYRNESGERRVLIKFSKENDAVKIANG